MRKIFILGLGLAVASVSLAASTSVVDQLFDNTPDGSPLLSLIAQANHTIDIEIYTMKDPAVAAAIKEAINVKHVTVRVIQTPNPVEDPCPVFEANSGKTTSDCADLRTLVDFVKSKGGQYVPFSFDLCGAGSGSVDDSADSSNSPANPKTCYQHGKIIVVDGYTNESTRAAMISTGNFDPTNLCDLAANPDSCNRDFSVKTTDSSVISALEKTFEQDLLAKPYDLQSILNTSGTLNWPAMSGQSRLTASPHSLTPTLKFISSATKSLQIENQYLEDPAMNDAIMAIAKKGIPVYVMVASATSFGRLNPVKDKSKAQKWTSTFQAFDAAGVHTMIFDDEMKVGTKPGYLHAKVILVDGKYAWVGSVNGSAESLNENREFGIFSDDTAFVNKLSSALYADFKNPSAETWQQSLTCTKDACGHVQVAPSIKGVREGSSPEPTL